MQGQSINLSKVSKSWDGEAAVQGVDLDVAPGTFTVLLGPSGCGKSTSLRIIAGLESADSGVVKIGDRDVTDLAPAKRDIAMVFQSYALFPHLSVAENILFGLKVRRTGKAEQLSRLNKTAQMLGLTDYLARKPAQLSGGQQQRVALGRAIIAEKPICLMDEPLSNLDAKLRNAMRTELRELQQQLGFSMVYVTHDQAEAITMADQVVLMRNGQVEQAGSPRDIYEQPATEFVAGFIGTPPMNLIPAAVIRSHLAGGAQSPEAGDSSTADEKAVTVGIRPEHITLTDGPGIACSVKSVEYLGADVLVEFDLGDVPLLARIAGSSMLKPKETVRLSWQVEHLHFFDSASGQRLSSD